MVSKTAFRKGLKTKTLESLKLAKCLDVCWKYVGFHIRIHETEHSCMVNVAMVEYSDGAITGRRKSYFLSNIFRKWSITG